MNTQKGFTLIELVVVILILGILAVSAVPRFLDLSDEAEAAALQGVVGAIDSASAINYGAKKAGDAAAATVDGTSTCQTAATAILQSGIPAGYTLDNVTNLSGTDGTANACVVTQTSTGSTANATIISAL